MTGFGRGRQICDDDSGLLSSFVDGALGPDDRDTVASHLLHCDRCRAEVAELRGLQDRLSALRPTARTGEPATGDLTARLVGIAGSAATDPLWARPFDHSGGRTGRLPATRRRHRMTLLGTVAGALTLMALVVAAGWVAAPPPDTPVLTPAGPARAAFARSVAQAPATMDAEVAVLTAPEHSQELLTTGGEPEPSAVVPGPGVSRAQAQELLDHVDEARASVPRVGWAEVSLRISDYEQLSATVETVTRSGQGTEVTVLGADGAVVRTANVPTPDHRIPVHAELTGHRGQTVAGRPATVVEASEDGQLRARWWVDDASGLLLRTETYATDGTLAATSQYTSLEVGRSEFVAHPSPRVYRPTSAARLTLGEIADLNHNGWTCHESLLGLPRTTVTEDEDSQRIESIYSDGVTTVLVIQQRGTVLSAPEGFAWDDHLGAYRNEDAPAMTIWQSRDVVFTVVTSDGEESAAEVTRALPHEAPVLRTRTDRVLAGWRHIWQAIAGD